MVREIVKYGNETLREKSHPVEAVTKEIRSLVQDMLQTMYANNGAGLAAEQIGRTESVCVVDVSFADKNRRDEPPENPGVSMPLVLINPEIVDQKGRLTAQEGCLSFPEVFVRIARAKTVTVRFVDLSGAQRELVVHGLLARAIQHELDHLQGVLLVDRMSHVQKVAVAGKLKRIRSEALAARRTAAA